jgi:hypothetical protein|tara:strand:+ start:994 stop:1476 length:483 start_codon:yes stop_codon:yes gene_type:complete
MKKLFIFAIIFLLPSAVSEMSHSPNEVAAGESFTALIDTDENVKSITFYVCTLEEPYTCYRPESKDRNDTSDGRFEFTYQVKNNDYPGYKYEIENEDNTTEKIPAPYAYYEGLEVKEMGDSHYFKVDIKAEISEDDSLLPFLNIISIGAIIAIVAISGRR